MSKTKGHGQVIKKAWKVLGGHSPQDGYQLLPAYRFSAEAIKWLNDKGILDITWDDDCKCWDVGLEYANRHGYQTYTGIHVHGNLDAALASMIMEIKDDLAAK